jgi:hypothetical protein
VLKQGELSLGNEVKPTGAVADGRSNVSIAADPNIRVQVREVVTSMQQSGLCSRASGHHAKFWQLSTEHGQCVAAGRPPSRQPHHNAEGLATPVQDCQHWSEQKQNDDQGVRLLSQSGGQVDVCHSF